MGNTLPWLTSDEISNLCQPLTQPAAQSRFLKNAFGIEAKRKPDGSLLVMRAQIEVSAAPPEAPKNGRTAPNRAALVVHFKNKAK